MPDTNVNPPVLDMPPGFEELSAEDRMLIMAYKDNPTMIQTYNAIKITQMHTKQVKCREECDTRLESLEDSRKSIKWWLKGAFAILVLLKGMLIAKWAKLFG
jgi:hypothetical protein